MQQVRTTRATRTSAYNPLNSHKYTYNPRKYIQVRQPVQPTQPVQLMQPVYSATGLKSKTFWFSMFLFILHISLKVASYRSERLKFGRKIQTLSLIIPTGINSFENESVLS